MGFKREDTGDVVIFVGGTIRSDATCCIGGDGIKTSVTVNGTDFK